MPAIAVATPATVSPPPFTRAPARHAATASGTSSAACANHSSWRRSISSAWRSRARTARADVIRAPNAAKTSSQITNPDGSGSWGMGLSTFWNGSSNFPGAGISTAISATKIAPQTIPRRRQASDMKCPSGITNAIAANPANSTGQELALQTCAQGRRAATGLLDQPVERIAVGERDRPRWRRPRRSAAGRSPGPGAAGGSPYRRSPASGTRSRLSAPVTTSPLTSAAALSTIAGRSGQRDRRPSGRWPARAPGARRSPGGRGGWARADMVHRPC